MQYYSLMTFDDSDKRFYLGRLTLVETDAGVRVPLRNGETSEPLATDGTVPYPWPDPPHRVPVPATVDTTSAVELAPMVSYYNRPYGPRATIIEDRPDTVAVYTLAPDSEVALDDLDVATYYENVTEVIDDRVEKVDRGYEWDDDAVPPSVVSDDRPAIDDATYVVGFNDGQDLHDPYSHLGISAADTAAGAIRDVLAQLPATPLWDPRAARIADVDLFDASAVFSVTTPIPAADDEAEADDESAVSDSSPA